MRKAQYDDIFYEWDTNEMFPLFSDLEEEEAYARHLHRLHH